MAPSNQDTKYNEYGYWYLYTKCALVNNIGYIYWWIWTKTWRKKTKKKSEDEK